MGVLPPASPSASSPTCCMDPDSCLLQGVQMVETEADSLEAEETFLEPSPEMESEGLLLETIQSTQLWGKRTKEACCNLSYFSSRHCFQ